MKEKVPEGAEVSESTFDTGYGRQKHVTNYTVVVDGVKVPVEVVNRATSYVATAMIGVRKLRNLPAQAN
ncbi:DUF4060 family protein [Salmonella enterica]|nr:DUF4060 family protein [Salmonella enterica]HCA3617657.1 DUF4060 family protein [Salmonella enterica subsp. diarizonae serovar 61:i:z]EEJ1962641.1 DUF4060 family protein [Salmonella enterica]EHK1058189.1 DUF4060 family protein [Salmonella enterica]EIB7677843.1 DUF4060 family protein [Salmonella enterica]